MDLELTDKVAVVTGASKGIGLAVTRALAERARVVAGARTTREPRRPRRRHRRGGRPGRARRPGAAGRSARSTSTAASTCWSTTSARVRLRLDGFLGTSDEEFEWAMQMNFFIALRATRAALAGDGRAGRRGDRQRRLGQRLLPARRRHDRLRRRQGRAGQPQQVAVAGVRARRASASTASRPARSRTDLWLGEHGVAETVAAATGVDADTARERVIAGIGGFATGRFTTPEEVATLVVLLASERTGQRDRRELRHRRRPDQDDLSRELVGAEWRASSCSCTTRRACTSTCASRSARCCARGRCPRARRLTRRSADSPCRWRTTPGGGRVRGRARGTGRGAAAR